MTKKKAVIGAILALALLLGVTQFVQFNPISAFAQPGDRTTCDAIRGKEYNSSDERAWWKANCEGGSSSANIAPTLAKCPFQSGFADKDKYTRVPAGCSVLGDVKVGSSTTDVVALYKGDSQGVLLTCVQECIVFAPFGNASISDGPPDRLYSEMKNHGCANNAGCATVYRFVYPFAGNAAPAPSAQTTTTGSTATTSSGSTGCPSDSVVIPANVPTQVAAGCSIPGDVKVGSSASNLTALYTGDSMGVLLTCNQACFVLAPFGSVTISKAPPDKLESEMRAKGCKNNAGCAVVHRFAFPTGSTYQAPATTGAAPTTQTTASSATTTTTGSAAYQQPAPSSTTSSADACGGKTQLGPKEEFVLNPGCHTVGAVYFWYNMVWADRFSDNPNSRTIGYVMDCPSGPCSIKSGDWTVGLSSKSVATIISNGCQSPCTTLQYKPVGAYLKGQGPDNQMSELPAWVPACFNSTTTDWNNSTLMKAEQGNYGINVQLDVGVDACRLIGMNDYHQLNPDLRLP